MGFDKGAIQSVTFWGLLIAAFGLLFPELGLTDEKTAVLAQVLVGVVGLLTAAVGRIRAKSTIKGLYQRPPAK
jgi:hypothetical protein